MESIRIFINGEEREIVSEFTMANLLEHFSLPQTRIAIELNRDVVRRKDWSRVLVKNADRIEVIHFVGGG